MVRPELLEKRIVGMIKERTWEADVESEMLLTFRKLDQVTHGGQEYGYIEADKMATYMKQAGFVPCKKAEIDSFIAYAVDETGTKM